MPKSNRRRHAGLRGHRQLVSMILLRQDGRCYYCQKPIFIHAEDRKHQKATLDHKTPIAFGGEAYGDNVVAACHLCNMHKGMLDEATFLEVRHDHERRKALIREAQDRIAAMPEKERNRSITVLGQTKRESLAQLQISLGPVVREYRKKVHGEAVITKFRNKKT